MSVTEIVGGHENRQNESKTDKVASDKEMFLKLLVAQLQHQDPLNPQEDKEFIAQLAQFTSLEELQNINGNIETMLQANEKAKLVDSSNIIGRRVLATGNIIAKYTDGESVMLNTLYYTAGVDLSSLQCIIRNTSTNEIVYAEELGAFMAGSDYLRWDGTNFNGKPVPLGKYEVSMVGKDMNGKTAFINTEIYGDVITAEFLDGEYYVGLADGRQIKFDDISTIGIPQKIIEEPAGEEPTEEEPTTPGEGEG